MDNPDETHAKLGDYLAQFMSASGGRREQTHTPANTVPVQQLSAMKPQEAFNGQSSDWSPSCKCGFPVQERSLTVGSLALKTHKASGHVRG
jgi:hypothetical protein